MTGLIIPARVGAISLFGCKVSERESLRGLRNEDRAMEEEEEEEEDNEEGDGAAFEERISA
jgi:hypothetical protein